MIRRAAGARHGAAEMFHIPIRHRHGIQDLQRTMFESHAGIVRAAVFPRQPEFGRATGSEFFGTKIIACASSLV